MRIMCLNGWGGTLHVELLRYLAAVAPDILCLQEVINSPQAQNDILIYRDGDHVLPQRANLFGEVAAVLPDHAAIFCPAAQGILWDGEIAVPSQWGIATFVRRSLPIIGQAQGFVHKSFSADGYGDHPRSRTAHVIRIHDHESDRALSIGHMHGLRDPRGKHDTPERLKQARKLAKLFSSVAGRDDAQVLCGDFNVEPGSATFATLAALGLRDLVTKRGFEGTRTSHYNKPGRFADYMLVNDALDVAGFSVVTDPEASDHCPLLLEI